MELAWKTPNGDPHCFLVRNPSTVIPPRVVRLTGIHPGDLDSMLAIAPGEARFLFEAASRGRTMVAHHAVYEKRWLEHLTGRELEFVCTRLMAKEALPELRSGSLRAVAGMTGHIMGEKRRALEHVLATEAVYASLTGGFTPPPSLREVRLSLPRKPGVYRFLDPSGRVLYVGKAVNLRNRVNGHFTGRDSGRHAEMLSRVAAIEHETHRTPLHAALRESGLICRLAPEYNIAGKPDDPRLWYLSPKLDHLSSSHSPGFHGPFTSRRPVEDLAGLALLIISGNDPVDFVENLCPDAPETLLGKAWADWSETVRERGLLQYGREVFLEMREREDDREQDTPEVIDEQYVKRRLDHLAVSGTHLCRTAAAARLLCGASISWHSCGGKGTVHNFVDNSIGPCDDQRSARMLRVLLWEVKRLHLGGCEPVITTARGRTLAAGFIEKLFKYL